MTLLQWLALIALVIIGLFVIACIILIIGVFFGDQNPNKRGEYDNLY